MRKSRCTDPTCRNYKHASNTSFCPQCRAQTALYYHQKNKKKITQTYTIQIIVKPNSHRIDHTNLVKMYDNSIPIRIDRFLQKVSIAYVSTYFGYGTAKQGKLLFRHDTSLQFFSSRYNGTKIIWMNKDNIHYIFSDENIDCLDGFILRKKTLEPLDVGHPFSPGGVDEYDEQW